MPHSSRQMKRQQDKMRRGGMPRGLWWVIGGIVLIAVAVAAFFFFRNPVTVASDQQDKSLGPKDAKVTITEYGDFQCPACKTFALSMEPRLKQEFVDTGQARLVFRNMAFIGNESVQAAVAAECANEQGSFWNYYFKLYSGQQGENAGTFSADLLSAYAQSLGLDMGKFNSCLSSGKYLQKVQDETNTGDQLGVQQTPAIFINGKLVDWGGSFATLESAIQKAVQETR
jgi:protein-disulfide isomerase